MGPAGNTKGYHIPNVTANQQTGKLRLNCKMSDQSKKGQMLDKAAVFDV